MKTVGAIPVNDCLGNNPDSGELSVVVLLHQCALHNVVYRRMIQFFLHVNVKSMFLISVYILL